MKSPYIKLIIAIVFGATALGAYGLWYSFIVSKSSAVADLETQINTIIDTASRVAAAKTALSKITGDETTVQSYFVPQTAVVAFINDLEARGHTLGSSVSVASVSTGGTYTHPTLVFELGVSGTFDSVMRTVGAIEYAPYALKVTNLSLKQEDKTGWNARIKLEVGSIPLPTITPTP